MHAYCIFKWSCQPQPGGYALVALGTWTLCCCDTVALLRMSRASYTLQLTYPSLFMQLAAERIYWDQATVLLQLGLLPQGQLPVTGAEQARKSVDKTAEPSNQLITRGQQQCN